MPKGGKLNMDKHYVGTLCKRWHEWENSGGSLRVNASRSCVVCSREAVARWRKAHPKQVQEINAKPHNRAARKRLKGTREHKDAENARMRRPENRARVNRKNRQRYHENERYRARCCLRARLREALVKYDDGKRRVSSEYGIDWTSIIEHVGPCPGKMGHGPGTFQLDHIRPLSSFNLSDPRQVRDAFDPENHQWLPWEEHLAKSAGERR